MLILDKKQIIKLTVLKEFSEAMLDSFRMLEEKKTIVPERMHVDLNGNTLLLMPAGMDDYFATKLLTINPKNPANGHPAIYAVVTLNDGKTGKPVALMDGGAITALRTGAVSGLGIRFTSPFETHTAGLVGAGEQGFYQLIFACMERPIRKVAIFDKNPEKVDALIAKLTPRLPCVHFRKAGSPEQLLDKSQIVITATTSETPVLPDIPELYEGKHIVAIGSFKPKMRELPDALFKKVEQVLVDTKTAVEESGDLIDPIQKSLIFRDSVIPFSKIASGKIQVSTSKTTVFKTVGMALFDLVAAKYVYEKALEKDAGILLDFD